MDKRYDKIYYFYLGRSKAKAKKSRPKSLFAIAFNAYYYRRTCQSRGWTDRKEIYWRYATAQESEIQAESKRVIMGRYADLESLLEDEKKILGESLQFKEMERLFRAVTEQNTCHPKMELYD